MYPRCGSPIAAVTSAQDVDWQQVKNHLVVLVEHLRLGVHQPAVGLGLRRTDADDGGPQVEEVTGPHGCRPAQLIHAGRSETGHVGQVVGDEQTQADAGGVQPAGNEATEGTSC